MTMFGFSKDFWRPMKKTEKRPPGRPEVAPEDRLKVGSIRLTQAQWDKLALLGGAEWLRRQIEKAKIPTNGR